MSDLNKYIDAFGMIDKLRNRDGGDNRNFTAITLLELMALDKKQEWLTTLGLFGPLYDDWVGQTLTRCHPDPGIILRHPNPNISASDWDRGSRDQIQKAVICMGYVSKKDLKAFLKGQCLRGPFAHNTRENGATKSNHMMQENSGQVRDYGWKMPDLVTPEVWGNIFRGLSWWWWPLLLITDLELFGGAIKWRFFAKPKDNLASNQTLSQMQAYKRMGTPWSWLANKINPIDSMVLRCLDHYDDPYVELPFIGEMFKDAWQNLKTP